MPAINLIQLRTQLNTLLWNFTDPPAFRKSLADLLERFAYITIRPGSETLSAGDKPGLQIPLIVLREIDLAMLPIIHSQPQAALDICDLLWNDPDPEICVIAARILGRIPSVHSDMVLDRAGIWARKELDPLMARTLLSNASYTILRTDPEILMRKARAWYISEEKGKNNLCLEAMIILAEDRSYENLPAIFTILESLLTEASLSTQQNIFDLFKILLERSPLETIYLIRQQLQGHPNPTAIRIVRNLIPLLPEESQKSIRDKLRVVTRKMNTPH